MGQNSSWVWQGLRAPYNRLQQHLMLLLYPNRILPVGNTLWSSKLHIANMQVQILVATSSSGSNPVSQSLWDKMGGVKDELDNKMLTKQFSMLKF